MTEEETFEERAASLGADTVYRQFRMRNPENLHEALKEFDDDMDAVADLLTDVVEEKEVYWMQFGDVEEREAAIFDMLATHLGKAAASTIMYPPKKETDDEPKQEQLDDAAPGTAYLDKDGPVLKIFTDNANYFITDPFRLGDGSLKAHIHCIPQIGSGIEYDERVKFTQYGVNGFAKQVLELNDLDDRDSLKKNIKQALLGRKKHVRRLDNIAEETEQEVDEDLPLQVKKALEIAERGGSVVDLEKAGITKEDIEEFNDYLFTGGDTGLILTEKGQRIVDEMTGNIEFSSEEEVQEKAEEVLETDPLTYYLESFNKVHISDHLLKIWELVSALSAVCAETQIHSWAVGKSGKGKSHIKRKLCEYYLPDNAYAKPDSVSPKAIYYKAEELGTDLYKNKVLFLDEAESFDSEEMIPLLRSLTDNDEDVMTHETVNDQSFQELKLEKPLTVWFTSTETINDEQLKNRFTLTNPDDSKEVDEEVNDFQQERLHRAKPLSVRPSESPVIRRMMEEIQDETEELKVVAPFRVEWKQSFNRRLYLRFYTLMELITKIHFKNRHIENGCIIATEADFKLASRIWSRLVATTVAQVDKDALRLVKALPETQDQQMTTSELAMELEGFSTKHVRDKAKQLMDTETLVLINGQMESGQWYYWAGRDRKLLAEPDPGLNINEDIMKDIVNDTDVSWSDDLKDEITGSECPVLKTLEELDFTDNDLNVDNFSEDHPGAQTTVESAEHDSAEDKYLSVYPEKSEEPKEIETILAEAEERFGIEPEKFEENIHNRLVREGDVYEPQPGKAKRM